MATITPTIKPLPKQYEAWKFLLDNVKKYILFGGGAGGGKSWMGCEWMITNCYRYPGSKWFIGRKELKALLGSTFETFKKVCKHHGIPDSEWKYNGQYNYILFNNGSKIDLLDLAYKPSDPNFERFGSSEYTGGWIEEAGEVVFKCFDVLKSRVGRHMNKELGLLGKVLLTANPTKNWLKRIFYTPFKNNTLPESYAFVQALWSDNIHTAKEYGENLAEIADRVTRERLKDGNWDYDDDVKSIFNSDASNDLFTNPVEPVGDIYITADIARFGGDKIVIIVWKGWKVIRIIVRTIQSLATTQEMIKQIAFEMKIPRSHILVDEDGIGGGVVDNIPGIKGFVGNSIPMERKDKKMIEKMQNGKLVAYAPKDNYFNLRAQCYQMFADKVNRYEIAIDCDDVTMQEEITEELGNIKLKDADLDKKIQIISKQEIKEMLGRSPDYSDGLMMRMYFELDPMTDDIQSIPYEQPAYQPQSKYEGGPAIRQDGNTYLESIKIIYPE